MTTDPGNDVSALPSWRRGVLIDPAARTLTAVEKPADHAALLALLQTTMITTFALVDPFDDDHEGPRYRAVVDDWPDQGAPVWIACWREQVIQGRAYVEGATVEAIAPLVGFPD